MGVPLLFWFRPPKGLLRRVMSVRPANLLAVWAFNETAGRVLQNLANKYYANLELTDNGGFETAGAGGADVFAYTQENAGDGSIADETVIVKSGGHAAKLTAGPSANTYIRPSQAGSDGNSLKVFPGMSVTLSFWTRGDGMNAGRYNVYDVTNSAWIRTTVSTGVAGTTYTQVSYSFTVPANCFVIQIGLFCPTASGGTCYFDDVSVTADMPYKGMYASSGMTYGQSGPTPILRSAVFSGTNSGLLIGTKAFGQAWNGNVGSVIAWGKVDSSARWTDASTYRYLFHPKSRQDATVYIVMGKNTTNHQLVWRRRVASGIYEKTYTFSPAGPTGWFCMGFAWDMQSSPKNFKGYVYAPGHTAFTEVFNETPSAGTGDQNWDNSTYTCDDVNTVLAGGSTTAQLWIGAQSLTAYWAGAALTPAEFRRVMVF